MYAGADKRNFYPMAQKESALHKNAIATRAYALFHGSWVRKMAHMARLKFEPAQFIPKIAATVASWFSSSHSVTWGLRCSFCLGGVLRIESGLGPRYLIENRISAS